MQERALFSAQHQYSGPKHSTLSGGVFFSVWTCPGKPLCPLDMLRYSPHCLAHYRAIVGIPAWCCRLITFSPCMGRYGVLCSGSTAPDGQLINMTPRAANLYANPCLLRLSSRHIVRSIPADLCALFGVKAAKNQEYLILIQVVKFMWLRCICADKWLYTAVYLYFSINDKAGNN